jgi:hypothetical protein
MNLESIQSTETAGDGDRARRISAISAKSQMLDALQKQQQQRHSDHYTQNQQMSNDLSFYNSKMGTQSFPDPPPPETSNSGIHRPLSNTSKPILKLNAVHSLNPQYTFKIEDNPIPDVDASQKLGLGSHHTTKSTAMYENSYLHPKTPPRPKFGLDNPYNSLSLQYKLEKLDQANPTPPTTAYPGKNETTEQLLKGQAS